MEEINQIFMHLVIAGEVITEIHRATLVTQLCEGILDDDDFIDAPHCHGYYIAEELNNYLKGGLYEQFIEKVKLELVIGNKFEILKELGI